MSGLSLLQSYDSDNESDYESEAMIDQSQESTSQFQERKTNDETTTTSAETKKAEGECFNITSLLGGKRKFNHLSESSHSVGSLLNQNSINKPSVSGITKSPLTHQMNNASTKPSGLFKPPQLSRPNIVTEDIKAWTTNTLDSKKKK